MSNSWHPLFYTSVMQEEGKKGREAEVGRTIESCEAEVVFEKYFVQLTILTYLCSYQENARKRGNK